MLSALRRFSLSCLVGTTVLASSLIAVEAQATLNPFVLDSVIVKVIPPFLNAVPFQDPQDRERMLRIYGNHLELFSDGNPHNDRLICITLDVLEIHATTLDRQGQFGNPDLMLIDDFVIVLNRGRSEFGCL